MASRPVLRLSPAVEGLSGGETFAYLAKARQLEKRGVKVINFGIGQPDFDTPAHVKKACVDALAQGLTKYTEAQGLAELREAVSESLNEAYGADVRPGNVLITPGAKMALFLSVLSYVRPGDEVVIVEPSYYSYAETVKLAGGRPVFVPLGWRGPSEGFSLDVELLERAITGRTRMVILNNPHNPTGAVPPEAAVRELIEVAIERNVVILADEVYDSFVYEGSFYSVLRHPEWKGYVVYVNSLSKTFAMTGWRLGYVVAHERAIDRMTKLAVNAYSCVTSFVQKAGIAALRGGRDFTERMVSEFKKRRDLMYELLRGIEGLEVWKPAGTFYMFPRVGALLEEAGMKAEELAEYLLERHGLVVVPGSAFPDKAGEQHLRLSFAVGEEDIKEGVLRLRRAIGELLRGSGPADSSPSAPP